MKIAFEGVEREVTCDELINSLPDSGEFEVKGEPIEVEKCWRIALWKLRGRKYILSYEIAPGKLKGFVIQRKRPSRRRGTPSKAPRRKSGKPSRGRRPSKRRGPGRR